MPPTVPSAIKPLHSSLNEYIEATYHISDKLLIARRKELLNKPGVIHQVPYLESTPRYETGEHFSDMAGLSPAALEAYLSVSASQGGLPRLIFDPPYRHQSEAVRGSLIDGRNLIIMTGTGSGKTESFLLPILGKLAHEASGSPDSFGQRTAVRALVLYPMNALVNDQLGRLRTLFGDPRLVSLFKGWAGRPPRFARYTSRTPYAGIRTRKKDSRKLGSFDEFYVDIERRARDADPEKNAAAKRLLRDLKERGKWPAKPDLAAWLGEKGSRWQDSKTGAFVRAVTLPDDTELLTRHEVQTQPPDLLITNYSMLEYMMMRPIERPIFDMTRAFLEANPHESFLVVLDEAHLYRGSAGAEVGILLRRLRDRLGIPPQRFQVICATASFSDHAWAPSFGAQLSGLPSDSFQPISGTLALRSPAAPGSEKEAEILAGIDLRQFHEATSGKDRLAAVKPLLDYRQVRCDGPPEAALHFALADFPPMGRLINKTMKQAVPVAELGKKLFPEAPAKTADAAAGALMALGSAARQHGSAASLLPSRIHSFFRGLPGLWVCMDPDCKELGDGERNEICGKMYSQPRVSCGCGARVLELYTCRNCGTAYARAYSDDICIPQTLWPEPGQRLQMAEGETGPLLALDLLLESPSWEDLAEPANYDLETGRLNPNCLGTRTRRVHIRSDRVADPAMDDQDDDSSGVHESPGQFSPCAVCNKKTRFGRSYVQDHQTKGDQPFQVLVSRQLREQPPFAEKPTPFAPLQGRKVLTFSDSRQVAARLAPNLQMYSTRDSLRILIAWGYRHLQKVAALHPRLCLEDLYLAVLLASKHLNVRLRPELKSGETYDNAQKIVENAAGSGADDGDFLELLLEIRTERPPEALLAQIVAAVQDQFFGFEALGLASIAERSKHTAALRELPSIAGIAESPAAKVDLARAWLRCWRRRGFWLSNMPPHWWLRPRSEGINVRGQKGWFTAMDAVLPENAARKAFKNEWLRVLQDIFTERTSGDHMRLRGSELALHFDDAWAHCTACKSVHRPASGLAHCLDCGRPETRPLNPDSDPVFLARKGFYRNPVAATLRNPSHRPMVLVAAEHTAQLNAPQNEDVFSKAEENEILFQDIDLNREDADSTAIDVLSSTTTMEVGIDIGALSGVALRNMPPSRANYQQRSGRAGRRGNAVATVVAFGSADSHDEHYFSNPDGMIRGNVVDPKLTLDNVEIVRRHVRAYLLQRYHQDRIPAIDPTHPHDLFSVLGTVSGFRSDTSILNRNDFNAWLIENGDHLRNRVSNWIPDELDEDDKRGLLTRLTDDCISAVDDAIGLGPESQANDGTADDDPMPEVAEEVGEERPSRQAGTEKLLDRLLYCGKLPRYAFPTDVATFHVFDIENSSGFRPIMRFAPQQSLATALSQYAPGKQVWISNKCYTSGAVYSANRDERRNAWKRRRIYMECYDCGFANTYPVSEVSRNEMQDCRACGGSQTFGPGHYWLRPPGFAHPVGMQETASPDDMPETSYATRAKLTMDTPDDTDRWLPINERSRVLRIRQHLLVSNTGPRKKGYAYCTGCGRIAANVKRSSNFTGMHRRPYPDDKNSFCDGTHSSNQIVVLGTDFITDIALFSLSVESPISLKPGVTATSVALKTLSEALAKAACELLELEPGEIMAEHRPALSPVGKDGKEAEIFLYDTLPGGAGFSAEIAEAGFKLFERARSILNACPEKCDSSCYRCLRSFKNKIEHGLLDRHIGAQLLEHLLEGKSTEFNRDRLRSSTTLLYNDLCRQGSEGIRFSMNEQASSNGSASVTPILAERSGSQLIIALSAPLTPDYPADTSAAGAHTDPSISCFPVNELLVRANLPAATRKVMHQLCAT